MPSSDEREVVEVSSRAAWRAWLEKHHAQTDGVWLVIPKKGSGTPGPTYEDAVEESLCFGWIDSRQHPRDEASYVLLFSPRKPGGIWARSNKKRIEKLVATGCMTPAGQAVIDAAKADGSWTALDDVEDLIVPDDLARALDADGDARSHFEAFSPSARKAALYWIASAKRPETRAQRIDEVVRAAARNIRIDQERGWGAGRT